MNAYKLPTLRELQSWMRWILTDPRGVSEALKEPRPSFPDPTSRCTAPKVSCRYSIADVPPLSPEARLEIYANAYLSRLSDSLKNDFPTLHRSLGEDIFRSVMASYVKDYPSTTTNLGEIGKALPGFLSEFSPTREIGYLAEIALLEWKIIESFYAVDCPPLDMAKLQAISEEEWGRAEIHLDPSVHLLKLEWPVDQLWLARERDNFEAIEDAMDSAETLILIHRQHWSVEVTGIDPIRFWILEELNRKQPLPDICERLLTHPLASETLEHDLPALVMQAFSDWVRNGIITAVTCIP